jgi:hypothetical protein
VQVVDSEERDASVFRFKEKQRVKDQEEKELRCESVEEAENKDLDILEEIEIEDFAVDGICGVY